MIRIGYFNDGPLLPIKEGAAEKIINLIRFQNIDNVSEVVLFDCERSWTNTKLLSQEDFKSVLLPEHIFYEDTRKLNALLRKMRIQACIFTNPENLLKVGTKLKRFHQKIIYDCHNVNSLLSKRIGEARQTFDIIEFMEYAVGQIAELILPCSSVDLEHLVKLGVPRKKMRVLENGVDTEKIKFVGPNIEAKAILFLGNIFYQPNSNAVQNIYKYCYQAGRLKGFKFIIAGTAPKDMIVKYQTPEFEFLGYVPDLNKVFKKTTVALAPLTEGSGTRIKILNYLSAGIPTITTKLGMEGLELTPEEIFISDDIQNYPKFVRKIVNGGSYEKLILNARRKVKEKYDWRVVSKKAISYYSELLN